MLLALDFDDRLTIELETEQQADLLVERLGFGVGQRAIEVRGPAITGHRMAIGLVGFFVTFVLSLFLVQTTSLSAAREVWQTAFSFGLPVLAGIAAGAVPRRPGLFIGTDGVVNERMFSRSHVPYGQLERVEPVAATRNHGAGLALVTKNGRREVITDVFENADVAASAIERITESMPGPGRAPAALARGGRPIGAWRVAVERAASAAGDFRSQGGLDRDALVAALSDAAVPVEQRIGAAMALRKLDAPSARTAIRFAVDSTVDAHTREALALLAEEEQVEDEALDAALARVHREER